RRDTRGIRQLLSNAQFENARTAHGTSLRKRDEDCGVVNERSEGREGALSGTQIASATRTRASANAWLWWDGQYRFEDRSRRHAPFSREHPFVLARGIVRRRGEPH